MVSLADVRRWNPAGLEEAFTGLRCQQEILVEAGDGFATDAKVEGWTGRASEAAETGRRPLVERMENIVAGVAGVRRGVADAADAITALHTGLAETDELARRYDYRIGDDGTVIDTSVMTRTGDPAQEEQRRQLTRERDRIKAELTDHIRETLRRAEDIDHDLAEVMRKAAHGEIGTDGATTVASAAHAGEGHGALSTLEPPSGGTVAQNAAWWHSLSSKERWTVLEFHLGWVGNLDGVPATVRNQANRSRLWAEQKSLGQEAGRLQAVIDDPNSKPVDLQHAPVRLTELDAKLAALDKIEDTLQHPGGRQCFSWTSAETTRAPRSRPATWTRPRTSRPRTL